MVHRCVRNLKEAVNGLEAIQAKITVNPKIKDQIQLYLRELREIQGEAKATHDEV
jgi:hypothetical protein